MELYIKPKVSFRKTQCRKSDIMFTLYKVVDVGIYNAGLKCPNSKFSQPPILVSGEPFDVGFAALCVFFKWKYFQLRVKLNIQLLRKYNVV